MTAEMPVVFFEAPQARSDAAQLLEVLGDSR